MKRPILILSIAFLFLQGISQNFNPLVDEMIQQVNLDSLVKYVRVLSGEDSVTINGEKHLITNRSVNPGNDLAADYLHAFLQAKGYLPADQNYSNSGRNVYTEKTGTLYPEQKYILCAHYDAVTDHCADDNASGSAIVMEAARIMSNYNFPYTIVFAFWDEEEIGLLGSEYYATQAAAANENILGVINAEMSGYDSNDDRVLDVHVRDIANSLYLSGVLADVIDNYSLDLDAFVHNPGTTASDHSSFWNENYGAIVFSEGFFAGDPNPFYHSSMDRIEHFNLPYYHEMAKLGTGSIASLGLAGNFVGIRSYAENTEQLMKIFPNPASGNTNISFYLSAEMNVQISMLDATGRILFRLNEQSYPAGKHQLQLDLRNTKSGLYVLRLKTGTRVRQQKLLIK